MTAESQQTTVQPMNKLTQWPKEPTLAELKMDLENTKSVQSGQMAKIQRWADNFHMTGSAKLPKIRGRSSVQPRLIRKQAEWRYPALSEPFLSNGKVFTVKPVSFEDKKAAQQNELVLNWQFDNKLNAVHFIDQYVHTCVDEGTVAVRVGWCRETKMEQVEVPVYGYFQVFDPQQAQELLQLAQASVTNPALLVNETPERQESVRFSLEKGAPYMARVLETRMVDQEKVLKNHPTVEVVDIRNLFIDPSCNGDPEKALFMAYSYEVTLGQLQRDKRYKNLQHVDKGRSVLSEPDHSTNTPSEFNFADASRKKLVAFDYWGYYDIEGKGHLTPIVATWIGETLIRMEKSPMPDGKPPFVIVPYLAVKKSVYGEPDGELLEENQKIIGAVTRGMIDIMARSANGQRGMAKNMLDAVNKRRYDAGLDYEFNPNVHPTNGVVEHKYPEIPQSAPLMLQMQNGDAESLTGVKTFDTGLNGASLGPVAAGVKAVSAATGQREMSILRRLAKGMAQIGTKIVAMNQEFMSEEEVIRITNDEFVTVRRDELQGNFDLRVDISTAEEDSAKANDLSFMLQTIGPLGDVSLNKIVLEEIATLRRMPDLARKIRDYVPQPDPIDQQLKQLEIQKLQAEIEKLRADAQKSLADAANTGNDAALNEAKTRKTHAEADSLDRDFVAKESGLDHQRDLEKIERQAEANQDLAVTNAILEQRNSVSPDGKVDNTPRPQDIREAIDFNAATRG